MWAKLCLPLASAGAARMGQSLLDGGERQVYGGASNLVVCMGVMRGKRFSGRTVGQHKSGAFRYTWPCPRD